MAQEPELSDDFTVRREHMVERQIRRRGITDPDLLEAMRRVPRHRFVPADFQDSAYDDRPLPIGEGQTISQPFIVARMAELAGIRTDHRVLEVGAGLGYAAAVYAHLAREVVAVEIRSALAERARFNLAGYANVTVIAGGIEAVPGAEPFDRILAAAAAADIPPALETRLAEGGRLVIPVGTRFSQHLWTVARHGDDLVRNRHEPVSFVPLM